MNLHLGLSLLLIPGVFSFLTLETLVEKKLGGEVTITTASASGWPELVKLDDAEKVINLYDVFSGCDMNKTGMSGFPLVNSILNSTLNSTLKSTLNSTLNSKTTETEIDTRNKSSLKNETVSNFTFNCMTTCQIDKVFVNDGNVNGEEIALSMLLLTLLGFLVELIREENGKGELGPFRRVLRAIHHWIGVCYEYVIVMMITVLDWMKNCSLCGQCCRQSRSTGKSREATVVQNARPVFVDKQTRAHREEDCELASPTVKDSSSLNPSSPVIVESKSRSNTPKSARSRGSTPGSAKKVRFSTRPRDAKGRFSKTPPPSKSALPKMSDIEVESPLSRSREGRRPNDV